MMKCEATCKPWLGYKNKWIIQECSHSASVNIDGINLCLKHAGTIAVRKLVNAKMAKTINKNNNLCNLDKF